MISKFNLLNHYFYVQIGTAERKQLEISFINMTNSLSVNLVYSCNLCLADKLNFYTNNIYTKRAPLPPLRKGKALMEADGYACI